MSIPRLELLAILIGVRSVKFVETQIKLPLDSIVLMSDSQCVLHWISSNKKLPVFIENRVKEIRHHENIQFRYVNTKDNPADAASRGCAISDLCKDKLWWNGPEWLLFPEAECPHLVQDSEPNCRNSIMW